MSLQGVFGAKAGLRGKAGVWPREWGDFSRVRLALWWVEGMSDRIMGEQPRRSHSELHNTKGGGQCSSYSLWFYS